MVGAVSSIDGAIALSGGSLANGAGTRDIPFSSITNLAGSSITAAGDGKSFVLATAGLVEFRVSDTSAYAATGCAFYFVTLVLATSAGAPVKSTTVTGASGSLGISSLVHLNAGTYKFQLGSCASASASNVAVVVNKLV